MTFARSIGMVVLSLAVLVGCEREEAAPTASPAAGGGAGATAATEATESATPSTPAAPAAIPDASTAGAAEPAAASPDAAAAAAATQPSDAAPSAPQQAQTLLDQTLQYIKDNKMELAEKSLAQLEQLKPQLPTEWHGKIDGARKAFTAAKTGQGLKLDGLLPSGGGTAK